jgi:hypothetical protein
VIGDRGYAKPPGLQHVLAASADFLERVGCNSMRMITPGGARLDLAAIYNGLGPGSPTELSVVVTRHSKGQGRLPRQLFPARLVIMRQQEAAAERATQAAKRQHSKKCSPSDAEGLVRSVPLIRERDHLAQYGLQSRIPSRVNGCFCTQGETTPNTRRWTMIARVA